MTVKPCLNAFRGPPDLDKSRFLGYIMSRDMSRVKVCNLERQEKVANPLHPSYHELVVARLKLLNRRLIVELDQIYPFQLSSTPVRGRVIRLRHSSAALAQQHSYPPLVQDLLNELVLIALILASGFKYSGIFTLQVTGNGPLRFMVVDVTPLNEVRACARFDEKEVAKLQAQYTHSSPRLIDLCGEGYLAFTIDQPAGVDRYQGVVELTGRTLVDAVEYYFRQSEQLQANLLLVNKNILNPTLQKENHFFDSGAIFIQKMPDTSGKRILDFEEEQDPWDDLLTFITTLSAEEILDGSVKAEKLLYRLFWNEGLRVSEPRSIVIKCRCSQEKIEALLEAFSAEDRQAMVVDENIEIACEFCHKAYVVPLETRVL